VTVSICQTLAALPGAETGHAITWAEVSRHLRDEYLNNLDEKKRMERAAERQRLYQSGGDSAMEEMLGRVFKDPEVLAKRREWIEFGKYDNVLRKIVGDLATVYSTPASRVVGDEDANERYREVQRLCRQHEVMQRVNRMAILHRALVVMPRMELLPDGSWRPTIDVVTPAKFHAIRHPLYPTQLIGLIFENDFALAHPGRMGPKWTLITWHETAFIDGAGEVIQSSVKEHHLGRIPAVLFTIEPPDGRLLDDETGQDLVSAHKMAWFLRILHAKEAKSATLQPVVQGDVTRAMRDQADDSEIPLELPEGATVQTLNRVMPFESFLRSAQDVRETAGSNYGLAPTIMRGESTQSADARELMRLPLRELRLQQQIPFRDFERELAELQALVVSQKRGDLAFSLDGWSIDFADPQTPLGTAEALAVFEKELELGLNSIRAEIIRRNPDLTPAQAEAIEQAFIEHRTARMRLLREFQVLAGGMARAEVSDRPAGIRPNNTGVENRAIEVAA